VLRDLFKIKGMEPLLAVVRSRLGIALLVIVLFIFSLTEMDRHKLNRIEQVIHRQERALMQHETKLLRHETHVIGREAVVVTKGLKLNAFGGKKHLNQVKGGQNMVDPLSPYRSVDSGAKGKQICICPIDRVVYLGMQTCSASCPTCHRHLKRAVYGGEGRVGQQVPTVKQGPGVGLKALAPEPKLLPQVKI
jgi:hypothetical protein